MTGAPPVARTDSRLYALAREPLDAAAIWAMIGSMVGPEKMARLERERQIDFSLGYHASRLRANAYFEKGVPAVAIRLIPFTTPSLDSLGLPEVVKNFTVMSQGFVLITGPTGHGKSTTLAGLVDHINAARTEHIITLEDPIEYLFAPKKSIISQREVGSDTPSFGDGLKAALREDPNVILVGEMRDLDTIEAALTLAETGHLVFATLHTNSAAQTVDRVIDVFPQEKQDQIRIQFANVLTGIVSQRLLPKIEGGRVLAVEVLVATSAIRNLIREGANHQIPNVIQTSAAEGMVLLDKQLTGLVARGVITLDEAAAWAADPKTLRLQLYQEGGQL